MKNKRILNALNQVDDKYINEAAPEMGVHKRSARIKLAALAACLALVLAVGIPALVNRNNAIPLSDASSKVKVTHINRIPNKSTSKSDLMALTEEEIFSKSNTLIFKGMVTKISNIKISFNGSNEYQALAEIKTEKVYRGSIAPGDTITVLVPCPIEGSIKVEDTGVISQLKVGMTGIFMPVIYDETSIWEENGARLTKKDLAPCGFSDGMRWAFLETSNGLVFERWSYESIADATTLEQIEEYILKMLGK